MQKLLLLLILSTALTSCSNEQKAKKAIKEHLSKTMHDFKSYEPVEFGTIDSSFTTFIETKEYKTTLARFELFNDSAERAIKEIKDLIYLNRTSNARLREMQKAGMVLSDSLTSIANRMASLEKSFTPEFNGYSLAHSFRGKNPNGALILSTKIFKLTPQLDEVIDVVDPEGN